MEVDHIRFRMPVSWDIAVQVLKHAARNGRIPLDIYRHDNGYLRLRHRRAFRTSIVLDIIIQAESQFGTIVTIVDMSGHTARPHRQGQRARSIMESLQSDAEFFVKLFDSGGVAQQRRVETNHPGTLERRTKHAAASSY